MFYIKENRIYFLCNYKMYVSCKNNTTNYTMVIEDFYPPRTPEMSGFRKIGRIDRLLFENEIKSLKEKLSKSKDNWLKLQLSQSKY